jgi:hypothetical protein
MRVRVAIVVGVLMVAAEAGPLFAQQAMGTVATQDAVVTGGLEVQAGQARLMSNVSVTAHDHTAPVALDRGGEVLVCATSQFHLLHSGTGKSLLFGLDRGAIELHTQTESQDVILTPDIRFTVEAKGTYDLRLRVATSGDTCVENAGAQSPVLMLQDSFSDARYRVMPGQHVLFERGNLREVVDNEKSACGCPQADLPVQLGANATPAERARAEHPFPVAASVGLVAQPNTPAPDPAQATETFSNTEQQPAPPAEETPAAPATTAAAPPATPPATPPGAHDIFHSIGHFFHKLFHPR